MFNFVYPFTRHTKKLINVSLIYYPSFAASLYYLGVQNTCIGSLIILPFMIKYIEK